MARQRQKEIGKNNFRNYAYYIAKLWFKGEKAMSKQAKTLTADDLTKVLTYIAQHKHSARNRAILLLTYLGGLRVGEVASLRYSDVLDSSGEVKKEVLLTADQTKGKHARTVFVSERLQNELKDYIKQYPVKNLSAKLFYTQKRIKDGFTANTLTQHLFYIYKNAGLSSCSSHSGRRSFITNLASKGVGVRVLASLAGHRSIATTQAYIDVNDDMKRKAVELV